MSTRNIEDQTTARLVGDELTRTEVASRVISVVERSQELALDSARDRATLVRRLLEALELA